MTNFYLFDFTQTLNFTIKIKFAICNISKDNLNKKKLQIKFIKEIYEEKFCGFTFSNHIIFYM